MNWERIESDWKKFKSTVREQWVLLSDDHLDRIAGIPEADKINAFDDAARFDVETGDDAFGEAHDGGNEDED